MGCKRTSLSDQFASIQRALGETVSSSHRQADIGEGCCENGWLSLSHALCFTGDFPKDPPFSIQFVLQMQLKR